MQWLFWERSLLFLNVEHKALFSFAMINQVKRIIGDQRSDIFNGTFLAGNDLNDLTLMHVIQYFFGTYGRDRAVFMPHIQ